MAKPGKIAFPVILVLGAITGYITYVSFTAAMPEENKIDSPYYLPLPPASEENEAGNAGGGGGAAQTGETGSSNQTAGSSNQTADTAGAATGEEGGGGGAAAPGGGAVTLNILEGSSIQGSPDYDPDELTVAAGSDVTVANQDTLPHTVTSGTSPTDPNSAQMFDTSLINGGESATLSLAQVSAGQYDYYCMVHPYMTGKLVVQ
jgi:plastocyanin